MALREVVEYNDAVTKARLAENARHGELLARMAVKGHVPAPSEITPAVVAPRAETATPKPQVASPIEPKVEAPPAPQKQFVVSDFLAQTLHGSGVNFVVPPSYTAKPGAANAPIAVPQQPAAPTQVAAKPSGAQSAAKQGQPTPQQPDHVMKAAAKAREDQNQQAQGIRPVAPTGAVAKTPQQLKTERVRQLFQQAQKSALDQKQSPKLGLGPPR